MFGRKFGLVMTAMAVALMGGIPATAAPAPTPGALIRAIPQPAGWRGTAHGVVLEYWTAGSNGRPVRASGALLLPNGPLAGRPIVAYDHGTSGLGPGCGQQTNPNASPSTQIDRLLAQGVAVIAPDYIGLGRFATGPHPYLEIRTEATATIDLVRAARKARPELSRTWAVMGGSQGGQAALGTAHLQAAYAPELDFRGTVAIDPESDVEKILPLAGPYFPHLPKPFHNMFFIAETLVGLRGARPVLNVDSYLSPRGKAALDDIQTACQDQISRRLTGLSLGDLLSRPLGDSNFRSTLSEYLAVPTSGYTAPILLLVNATDLTVPSPLHGTLIAQLAANGVDFQTVAGTGRHVEISPGMQQAMDAFFARILRA